MGAGLALFDIRNVGGEDIPKGRAGRAYDGEEVRDYDEDICKGSSQQGHNFGAPSC